MVAFSEEEAKRRKHVGLAFEQGRALGEEMGRLASEADILKCWIKIMGDMNTQLRELIEQGRTTHRQGTTLPCVASSVKRWNYLLPS